MTVIHRTPNRKPLALLLWAALALPLAGQGMGHTPTAAPGVSADAIMVDQLGNTAPLDTPLKDEEGRAVTLRELVQPGQPILLNPFYYGCPGMCGAVQNAMLDALKRLELLPGRDYSIVSVDVDDRNGPETSQRKKATYVGAWQPDLSGVDLEGAWRFATGDAEPVRKLMDAVGFQYRYRPMEDRIDHPPTLIFLAPDGTVARYLNLGGSGFSPRDIKLALYDASNGEVGGFIEQILVSCLTYNAATGAYNLTAMTVMQIGGGLTLLIFAVVAFVLIRKTRRRPNSTAAPEPHRPDPVAAG